MIAFCLAHMLVPLYTIALSLLDSLPTTQLVVYYFSSTVKSLANTLIFLELAVLLMCFFAQSLTESTDFGIRSSNLISNLSLIVLPFLIMTGFLYYEVNRYQKEYNPAAKRLYSV